MKPTLFSIILSLVFFASVHSQTFYVHPYVQNIDTTSVFVLWETSTGSESTVEWGLDSLLGNTASGTTVSGASTAVVHQTQLTSLTPDTRYFYRVVTGTAESDIYSFRTLPTQSSGKVVRIIAISDCQFDAAQLGKLSEVVNQGIIAMSGAAHVEDWFNMVLLVGDNVNTGSVISQWRDEFFANMRNLSARVSLFPVIGNHEGNSTNYFAYFNLPANGTAGFLEHWYYKDVSNVRIIGFDSNTLYQINQQLTWLSNLLDATASDDSIDFVILMQHHPWHSEPWLPGETVFAQKVLDSLAQFSRSCDKPVVFLFGHTHAYSRGQMKDDKVMQINVATASGYIDAWGSTSQADYPEFNMSFDEYGFMVIEANNTAFPEMCIRRYTRGDPSNIQDNVLQDSILLRRYPESVVAPVCLFPVDSQAVNPECVKLTISEFVVFANDSVEAVEYEVATDPLFSNLFFSQWNHTHNWYFDADTRANDTLYHQLVSGLNEETTYYWRARYRTRNLDWSNWSGTEVFVTGSSASTGNLLINPGAENGTTSWNVTAGVFEALTAGECAGTTPHSGTKYFAVGGLCTESAYGEVNQVVDLSSWTSLIDAGTCISRWGGYLSDYANSDIPSIYVEFLDQSGALLSSPPAVQTTNTTWTLFDETDTIPAGTRSVRFVMTGTRVSGTDNDSYLDDVFFELYTGTIDCDSYLQSSGISTGRIEGLRIFPVPAKTSFNMEVPAEYLNSRLCLTGLGGQILKWYSVTSVCSDYSLAGISRGYYLVRVEKEGLMPMYAKLVVE
jgi:hypothetical protein